MPKGIMCNFIETSGVLSDMEGDSINKCIYAFSFLVGKHCEPQSINAKLFLPIIPISIVADAFTLLWDNLCRNSCICIMLKFCLDLSVCKCCTSSLCPIIFSFV